MSETALPSEARLPSRDRVSVVVTTYNRQEMLRRCLTALLACPTADHGVDVVIVDDGSQDNTGDVVGEIIAAYTGPMRLRYVRQENAGHSAAVNRGVRETATEVVLILDDQYACGRRACGGRHVGGGVRRVGRCGAAMRFNGWLRFA